jgi:hypothetical protein
LVPFFEEEYVFAYGAASTAASAAAAIAHAAKDAAKQGHSCCYKGNHDAYILVGNDIARD